jgi:hypothetical protein
VLVSADVEYAEPDYFVSADATYPTDPLFNTNQWGMKKIGAPEACEGQG